MKGMFAEIDTESSLSIGGVIKQVRHCHSFIDHSRVDKDYGVLRVRVGLILPTFF